MTLNIRNVADAISKINVTGLVIKDIDEIPAEVGQRSPANLIPLPNFIGDASMERDSFGGGSTAAMTFTYTLNYRLLYEPAVTQRAMTLKVFEGLVEMIGLIWDAVLALDVLMSAHTEVVDLIPTGITNMGIVNDPADNAFYGCDLSFEVMEFVN